MLYVIFGERSKSKTFTNLKYPILTNEKINGKRKNVVK